MNSITKFPGICIPSIIGIGITLVRNRIIKNEKGLKDHESEPKLQQRLNPIEHF